MGLKLDRAEIRIACGLRLGSPVVDPHKCKGCGEMVTRLGRHGLSCKKAKGTHSRHWHGNELIKRALISAQIPARREPQHLDGSSNKRPDGRTMVPWSEGKILVWDYTVADTLAQSYVGQNSSEAGKSALQAEKKKLTKYQELERNYIVMPVAQETIGPYAPMGLKFLKEIGSRIMEFTGDKQATSRLFQRIGIACQRGNAASVMGTLPSDKDLNDLFDILS